MFAPSGEAAGPGAQARPRVLIVEDDHLVAMHVEATLLDVGFEVVGIAATAEEAIDLTRAERPDLAVMDIRLAGDRDGIDAALELLRDYGLRSIFASAHQDPRTKLRAEPALPLGWLNKPYQPDALVEAIYAGLDQLRRERR